MNTLSLFDQSAALPTPVLLPSYQHASADMPKLVPSRLPRLPEGTRVQFHVSAKHDPLNWQLETPLFQSFIGEAVVMKEYDTCVCVDYELPLSVYPDPSYTDSRRRTVLFKGPQCISAVWRNGVWTRLEDANNA